MVQQYDAVDLAELAGDVERFDLPEEGNSNEDYLKKYVIMPKGAGFKQIRLLPPAKGKKLYCATRTHRLLKDGDDPKKARNLHCPRQLATVNGKKRWVDEDPKKPCPICMYCRGIWALLEAAGGVDAQGKAVTAEGRVYQEEYRRIKAVERYYYNCMERVFDKNDEISGSEGPKIFSTGVKLHEKLLRRMLGDAKIRRKGLGDVTDFTTGRDLKVIKVLIPPQNYPNYDESDFEESSPLGNPDEIEAWLKNLHDLAALRVVKSLEEIDMALQKYTGAIEDNTVAFDMSKYRKKDANASVDAAVAAEKQNRAKPEVVPTPTGDEHLLEKDWMDGLGKQVNAE